MFISACVQKSIAVGLAYSRIESRLTPEIVELQARRDEAGSKAFHIQQKIDSLRLAEKVRFNP